jgi:hypothetical protein
MELVIPCRTANKWKPSDVRPEHVFLGNDATGAAMTQWRCPHCKVLFERRKPCEGHMGMIMNKPAGCRVLKNLDEARREEGLRHQREMRAQEQREDHSRQIMRAYRADTPEAALSDELKEIRQRREMNEQDRKIWE